MRSRASRPRLAFVGLGWIGRHRLNAIAESGLAEIVVLADADAQACEAARPVAPQATCCATFDDALEAAPDGVVLATPSALHAEQTCAALDAGIAVFCQKPLGRTAAEVAAVVAAAQRADRLLGVDVSYRYAEALRRVHDTIRSGAIGDVFALDLVFHNAYGPDKAWFYDVTRSGGGCLLDLGIHLVDFLHWTFDAPVTRTASQLFAAGRRLGADPKEVEDFAAGTIELACGAVARLACSWRIAAGCDAQIAVTAYGTSGGAAFRNVGGSFYDFVAEHYRGTNSERLCAPPDAWGGRAAVAWTRQLRESRRFDPSIGTAVTAAQTLDDLYGRAVPATAWAALASPATTTFGR